MMKVPEHQVAGHKAKEGVLGPLVDERGRFFKPLQNEERGSTEVWFYSSLSSHRNKHNDNDNENDNENEIPLSFFPAFHGTQVVEASDGSGPHPHLVLEDLLHGYAKPSVMDVKIGSRTWNLGDSEDYINKCLAKDRESSTIPLGFRISGVKDALSSWEPSRKSLQNLSAHGVLSILNKFVSSDAASDSHPDCAFASQVFRPLLDRLLRLKAWFEVQTLYHFYSCSLLLLYDKGDVDGERKVLVKLVDFAHVVPGNGAIDHNFLGGLCSFIKFLKDVLHH